MNEKEVQEKIWMSVEKRNMDFAWQKFQNPAIDAGPEKKFGHVSPQESMVLKKYNSLHNDFGIKYRGYCSDLQRMWFLGKESELPGELELGMKTIVGAIERAAFAIKPGVQGHDIDKIARDYLKERGHDEFLHALGHQVGQNAHDGRTLLCPLWEMYGDKGKGVIEENQIFTIEPSLQTENYGWVALEEMVVVRKDGCEFLVPPVKDFIYIKS